MTSPVSPSMKRMWTLTVVRVDGLPFGVTNSRSPMSASDETSRIPRSRNGLRSVRSTFSAVA